MVYQLSSEANRLPNRVDLKKLNGVLTPEWADKAACYYTNEEMPEDLDEYFGSEEVDITVYDDVSQGSLNWNHEVQILYNESCEDEVSDFIDQTL